MVDSGCHGLFIYLFIYLFIIFSAKWLPCNVCDLWKKSANLKNSFSSVAGGWIERRALRLLPPQGFRPEGEIPRRHRSNSRVY